MLKKYLQMFSGIVTGWKSHTYCVFLFLAISVICIFAQGTSKYRVFFTTFFNVLKKIWRKPDCGALTLCARQNELNHYHIPTLSFIRDDLLPTMRVWQSTAFRNRGKGSKETTHPHRWRWDGGAISNTDWRWI